MFKTTNLKPGKNYTKEQVPHANAKAKLPKKAAQQKGFPPQTPGAGYQGAPRADQTRTAPPMKPASR